MQTADINDMKICYVLLDGSNATSDIFYFTVEDNGRTPLIFNVQWLQATLSLSFNGCLKFKLLALCRSPKCLHHKGLKQLAMTDTQYQGAASVRPTGKGSRFKGQGSKGT